ncbi:hypothetical protein KQX54_011618 [Cotesia glomerata]|uniref:Galectin n=1 Tax=Cotesia glomerata TaxID=32391 RepID=A0AAV7ILD2_COTGL|nr:hypothetical protein KQX54_011618 [Cotesia glomerata]
MVPVIESECFSGDKKPRNFPQFSAYVITITRAKASAVNVKFNNPADNVGLIELSVTNSSTIQVARNLFQDDVDNSPPRVVKLEDAPNERGRLAVSGWLKLPFGPVVSFGSTIGSGVIIDGKFKLRVHVHDYRLPITFPQGAHIKVICESGLDRNEVSTILTVRSSADVSLDASKPPLTESEMRRLGMITPSKRKAVDDSNVATKKPTVGSEENGTVISDNQNSDLEQNLTEKRKKNDKATEIFFLP